MQNDAMLYHASINNRLLRTFLIKGTIKLAGNQSLRIYGTLACAFGKRMKKENRVFFINETEAIDAGFRPCGHCMHDRYVRWKNSRATSRLPA